MMSEQEVVHELARHFEHKHGLVEGLDAAKLYFDMCQTTVGKRRGQAVIELLEKRIDAVHQAIVP